MALRNISDSIKTAFANNDPLLHYHLVKFEKPSQLQIEAEKDTDYVYITDAPYVVSFDPDHDENHADYNPQDYIPGGLLKVGKVPESTEAKATNMSLTLSAAKLGKKTVGIGLTNQSTVAVGAQGNLISANIKLFESGFYPGDIVTFKRRSNGDTFKARIDRLYEDNVGERIAFTNIGTATIGLFGSALHDVEYDSSQVDALVSGGLDNTGATTTFSSVSFDNYINRSVTIYRVFANPATGARIGDPVLLFKGIIAKGTLNDKAQGGSTMTWSLTSHWGDFVRVNGRITSDEFHRGLDSSGISSEDSAIRPEYIHDLGFMHADSSLNVIASYTDIATRGKSVKRGGLAGLLGGKKYKEEKYEVTREMNLSLNLDAKYIPLVYGVQKVDTIPVFADVVITHDQNSEDNVASGQTELFQAQVLCEGPIGGVFDIYMDDKGLVCRDKADSGARTGSDNDVPCIGRMDRGSVLEGQGLYSNTLLGNTEWGSVGEGGEDYWRDPNIYWRQPRLFGLNGGFQNSKTGSKGILHGQSFKFPEAKNIQLTVHCGKEDQDADQTLLGIANGQDFLVQQNYYRDDATTYWTANHQLLDTAYVVSRDIINAEDGRAPELSFVVRGKFVNCYNYDGSYRISQGNHTDLKLGDTVDITLANGTTDGGEAQVIDKWSFINASGSTEYRIRFGNFETSSTEEAIIDNGTVGKFTATKTGTSNSVTFISPEYSNNPNAPVAPTAAQNIDSFVFSGTNFRNLSLGSNALTRVVTVTTSEEPIYGGHQHEPDIVGTQTVTRYNYKYTIDFSGLSTYTKNALRVALEARSVVEMDITANSNTSKIGLVPGGLDSSTLEYTISGLSQGMEALFGFPGVAGITNTSTTNATPTGVNLYNRQMIVQNSSDTLDPTDADGLFVEIIQEDLPFHKVAVRLPTDSTLRSFCDTNNILLFTLKLPDHFTIGNAQYKYGVKGSHLDVEQFGDDRVSINPAMQLLDYLTSKRYGKGLDIERDLDLNSFREVARSCDTQSKVILLFGPTTSVTDEDKYRFPASTSEDLLWQGTVESSSTVTYNSTSYTQVVFKDCIGKLGRKWQQNKAYVENELVWTTRGYWGQITTAGTVSEPTQPANIAVNLSKVGDTNTTIAINTIVETNLGNPFVKQVDSNGNLVSGYTLYDSDDVKYWKYVGWDSQDQRYVTRHQTNATIDTSQSLFDNVNSMLRQFNAILRFANGKYFLDQRVKAKDINLFGFDETITDDDIVGDIKIGDKGISKTFNSVNAQVIDPANNFEPRSIAFYNSNYKKQDKGVPRQGSFEAPGISNYFNARMNIKQVLDESRAGLDISFTMAPRAYMLLAGNLIAITYPRFNWTKKLFRIENLNVRDDLLVDIVAKEHNDTAYVIDAPPSDLVAQYNTDQGGKPPVKPVPPSNLTATTDGGQAIELNWTNADNYNDATHTIYVYRSTGGATGTKKLIGTTKGTSFTDKITNTGPSNRHYWIKYVIQTINPSTKQVTEIESFFHPFTNGVAGAAVSIVVDEVEGGVTINDGGVTFPDTPSGTPSIKAGITGIDSGNAGFLLGYDGTNHVFQVGDPSGSNFKFDGTDLSLTGSKFSVAAPGATAPSISGTTTSGKGSLLKADGDVFFGDASGFNIFFDQSEGTLTLTGEMVTENNIATNAITADKIRANSISADKIAANSITTEQLQANSITANQIAANSINSDMITANSVVSSLISASTITSSHIKSNSIVATIIDATSITASDIQTATLSALSADLGDITAGTMKGGSIPDANNAPAGSETGAFMDLTNGKMVFGNANKHVLFDGSNLVLSGVTIDAQSIINANASLSIKEDATEEASSATALNFTSGLNVAVTGTEATISLDTPTDNNFTTAEKTKLTGIATGANAYVLPNATTSTVGGVSVGSRLTVDGAGDLSADIQSDNNFTTALLNKLNAIEANATADQTAAEIRSLVEAASDSNVFTDDDHTKLNNIEAGATGDQTAAEIRTLVGSASDSNVFTDAEQTKLSGIETGATADQTAAEIRTLVGSASDSNVFTDAEQTKLSGIAAGANAYVLPNNNVTNASVSGSTLTLTREGTSDVTFTDTNTQYTAGTGLGLSGTEFSVDSTVVRTSGTQTIGGTKTFTGNVTFSGTTTYINTTNLNVGDSIITLNADFTGSTATENAGIEVERGDETNVQLLWSESGVGQSGDYTEGWTLGNKRLQAGTFYGNFVGDITGSPTSLAGVTTDDLIESSTPDLTGTARGDRNAYFTNARARGAFSAGTGITLATDGTITNSAPDQTVSLTGGGATSISGTYPNFTISSTDTNTVPNNATITISAGTDLGTGGDFTTNQSSAETITINHSDIARTNTSNTASPGYGASFTVIDSITTSARGHVTAVNTKTVTIPASDNTDTNTVTQIREDSGTYRTGNITLQSGSNVTISESSAGVFNFAATDTNTTNFNIQANGGTTENISAGETINFIGSGTTSVSRSGNSITISSSASTNNFVDGATFNTGNGIITLSRSGLSDVTVDIDGRFINNTSTQGSNLYIRNTSPTIYLRDTDHISSMIHQNSNLFYILRADAADDASWTTFSTNDAANGRWPLQMNLTNSGHYVYFGSPNLQAGGHTVWHAGNDGADTGLHADLLDGQHGSYYLNYNNLSNKPSIPAAANNATITLEAGNGLTTGGAFTTDQGTAETITFHVGAGTGISVAANSVGLSNSGVTAGTYGSSTSIPSITVNAQGQITSASGNSITIPNPNNGTLTLATGDGLDGSATFTADQSGNSTFTVSVDFNELTAATVAESNDSLVIVKNNGATRKMLFSEFIGDQNLITGNVTGTLLADVIVANSIETAMLKANTITAGLISADLINATHIAANAVTAEQMQVATTSGSGIYMELVSGNGVISIKDGTTTRVKIGYLGT